MKYKSPVHWEVRREDCGFFTHTHRRCWETHIRCKGWMAARRHALREQQLGNKVIIERWRRVSKRSPKYKYGPYLVSTFTVSN